MSNSKAGQRDKKLLGEMLLEAGVINNSQLTVALGQQKQWGGKLGSELLRLGFIAERELALVLQKQLGIKWISLFDREIPPRAVKALPVKYALQYLVMPVECDGKTLTLAATNPTDLAMLDTLAFMLGKTIRPVMALESDINMAILRYYDFEGNEFAGKVKEASKGSRETGKGSRETGRQHGEIEVALERETTLEPPKRPTGNPSVQTALVNLLLKKNLITRKELLDELNNLKG